MGHLGDTAVSWEWDSVLLLANPSLDSSVLSSRTTFETHTTPEAGANFVVGQSWADMESLQTSPSSPSDAQATTGPQSSSTVQDTTSGYETFRDPRLDCPNFLAGRVPCACTDNEGDEGGSRSKRAKVSARCQVPACGADLARMKSYHQRHRVCLRCANATTVILSDGTTQRYCQQCGKFHMLTDFDEGKRSCRRKLERHNNRRRRKLQESGEDITTPTGEIDTLSPKNGLQEEEKVNREENALFENRLQVAVEQTVQEPQKSFSPVERSEMADAAHVSTTSLLVEVAASKAEGSHEAASGQPSGQYVMQEPQTLSPAESERLWDVTKRPHSPTRQKSGVDEDSLLALLLEDTPNGGDCLPPHSFELVAPISSRSLNKQNSYTSSCPTGRISFKLYDWNPGDFPRNLRQQIMEWLSNMPVDLEGYIRSGCTILSLFVAMPQPMWDMLNADWEGAIKRLVQNPVTSGFWDKGYFNAKLGIRTVHFENGKVVSKIGGKEDCMPCVPVLYSVDPLCFQTGRKCELTITGRNLLQANTKLLVSHGGKYLDARVLQAISRTRQEDEWQVIVPALTHCQAGPVFIEVENEGRTSNAMVVLVADKEFCNEVETLELETSSSDAQDLLHDLGWMLRETPCEADTSCSRLQKLHEYADSCGWRGVADRVIEAAERAGVLHKFSEAADIQPFDWGSTRLERTLYQHPGFTSPFVVSELKQSHPLPSSTHRKVDGDKDTHILVRSESGKHESLTIPLLPIRRMTGRCHSRWGKRTYRLMFAAVSVTAACAGLCIVVQHPNEVAQLSTSLRRCLWGQ